MFFSTMHEPLAIRLHGVSKLYKLHGSQGDQLIDVLRLQRFGFRTRAPTKEFAALSDVSIDVSRGHRIGIVGRNGAGKTTLLKLICGNFMPTSGEVEVNGTVQALMNIGMGFHPEYTGRENVQASLQYNGLGRHEYEQAMSGVVEFCELGDFLDQPFKTYSLGMQARLMFAAATAIRPDILIVDEVLGAGDAYFVAKSKQRVASLVGGGCTMLLVSHSMQQVLELCDEAIWLEQGRVRERGDAFSVVKSYEESMHGPISSVVLPRPKLTSHAEPLAVEAEMTAKNPQLDGDPLSAVIRPQVNMGEDLYACLQEPRFMPHAAKLMLDCPVPPTAFSFVARGGLSRWEADVGVKVAGFSIVSERGISNELVSLRPAKFVMHLVGEINAQFRCRYGLVFNDPLGNNVCIVYSSPDTFTIERGGMRKIEVSFNPLQLGAGEYTVGISILEATEIERVNQAKRYDLLGRSFHFSVQTPESLAAAGAQFFHSAEWEFKND